jgi:hypothetical protein
MTINDLVRQLGMAVVWLTAGQVVQLMVKLDR